MADEQPNERLRAALLESGVTYEELGAVAKVDWKTVERWVTKGRRPYRRHRYAAASHLKVDESYLWPEALSPEQVAAASKSELVAIYPNRYAVPRDIWARIFGAAEEEIGVLAYAGLFLAEDSGIIRLMASKAKEGVNVRILLGDPESPHVAQRGKDEGVDEAMEARIRNVIVLYKPLRGIENIEFRLHDTVLYNSIYRGDGQMLVNTHIYGVRAPNAPLLHFKHVPGGEIVNTYVESFDRIWDEANPLSGD